MLRYKTKEWKDLSDGEAGNSSKVENGFEKSGRVILYPKKNKLGPCRVYFTRDTGKENNIYRKKTSFLKGDLVYYLVDVGSDLCIRKVTHANAFTLVHTFTSAISASGLLRFLDKAIVSYYHTGEKVKYASLTDLTTWVNTNLVALTAGSILDYKIVHDKLYVLTNTGKLCVSSDGVTFTLLVSLPANFAYWSLEYLDGFLYVTSEISGAGS